jgi:hypothetical protein
MQGTATQRIPSGDEVFGRGSLEAGGVYRGDGGLGRTGAN